MHRSFVGVSLSFAILVAATNARAQGDPRPEEVVLASKFVEVYGEYRNFLNWKTVSGDDPSVVQHDVSSSAGGVGVNVGIKIGGLPLWAQVGGYASSGLSTNTTLANGDHIHGKVNDWGGGGGVRLMPIRTTNTAVFLWAMGYYDRNDGTFDITDGSRRSESRIHNAWVGDYGLGAMRLLDEMIGLEVGISYTGIFDKKNADENLRFRLGMVFNPPRDF